MKDIEIPFAKERDFKYRFFEMLPGILTWGFLFLPFILAIVNPYAAIYFIIGYLLLWFAKSIGLDVRVVQGYMHISRQTKLPWRQLLEDIKTGEISEENKKIPSWHPENLSYLKN